MNSVMPPPIESRRMAIEEARPGRQRPMRIRCSPRSTGISTTAKSALT
jgi:hypothetical protein